jgi:hypothetical protein
MSGNIFAVGRMLFSALLAAGGIAAIWFGYKLFLQGSGLHKGVDKLDFKADWGKISFAGMSVGGLLMLTAGVWGSLAYLSIRKLEQGSDVLRITDTFKYLQGPGYAQAFPSLPPPGTPVRASDKALVGTVTSVLLNKQNRPFGYVVDGTGDNKGDLVFSPYAASYSNGNVTLKFTKDQIDRLWKTEIPGPTPTPAPK